MPKLSYKILVIGGYGLIGRAIVDTLVSGGHDVVALGRSAKLANRANPDISWIIRDLSELCSSRDWHAVLEEFEFVVNCAGVLQDTHKDNLMLVHEKMIAALVQACEDSHTNLVQISAVGATKAASTEFLRTKATGDELIRKSNLRFWILRPGLVIAPNAYGGTAMLRMLAAFPYVQPLVFAGSPVQTVSVQDVSDVVCKIVDGQITPGKVYDLVETEQHSLAQVVAAHRSWLGLPPPRTVTQLPNFCATTLAFGADFLGKFGWRSPARSSAMAVLREGIVGDPMPLKHDVGELSSLSETLNSNFAGAEYRLAARMQLLMPLLVLTLSIFWFLSGLIGLVQLDEAAKELIIAGWPSTLSVLSVIFWSMVDMTLAGLIWFRSFAKTACLGMVAVSLFYLLAASVFTPVLWLDPLGPLLKIVPGLFVPLVTWMTLETR